MSVHKDSPRRTSKRANKGVPPTRYEGFSMDGLVVHSPPRSLTAQPQSGSHEQPAESAPATAQQNPTAQPPLVSLEQPGGSTSTTAQPHQNPSAHQQLSTLSQPGKTTQSGKVIQPGKSPQTSKRAHPEKSFSSMQPGQTPIKQMPQSSYAQPGQASQPSPIPPLMPSVQARPSPSSSNERTASISEKGKHDLEEVKRSFDRKMEDMQNEFKRQMHLMQSLLVSNNQQLQASVSSLQNEVRTSMQQQPTLQPPSAQQPTYQPPSAQQPTHQPTSKQQPTFQPPSAQQPTLQPPTQQPTLQSQSTQQPTHEPPSAQQPTYQPTSTQQPTLQPPSAQQPTHQSMSTQQPTLQPPSAQQQTHQPPSMQQPTYQWPCQYFTQTSSTHQPTYQMPSQNISQQPSTHQPMYAPSPSSVQQSQSSLEQAHQTINARAVPYFESQRQFLTHQDGLPIQLQQQAAPQRWASGLWNDGSQQSMSMRQKKIHPLPLFTGLPEEWQTFAEAFQSTTREFEYSNLHNIMRLRDALRDQARDTVESLLASSNNVCPIMEALEETFGRPEQLIKSQVEKVRTIPRLAEGNLDALVNFANAMMNMSTFLKNAKGEHHLSNPTLLSELVAKLPTARQMQWAEKCLQLERPPTIVDFSNWLNSLRRLANMVTDTLPSTATQPTSSSVRRKTSNMTNNNQRFACVSIALQKCRICEGECTNLNKCHRFLQLSTDQRWAKVKELKVCFCCLNSGHRANVCTIRRRCGIGGCSKRHHNLLHSSSTERRDAVQVASQPNETRRANITSASAPPPEQSRRNNENQNLPVQSDLRSCHADCGNNNNNVLFQILPIKLYGSKKVITTYAFVDDGANVSMMDYSLAKELGISGYPDTLQIQWLNEYSTRQKTEVVAITVSGVGENAQKYQVSNVYTSKNLVLPTQSFHNGELLRMYPHLDGLPLHEYSQIQPKIILSLNHAFLTVPIEVPRAPPNSGPIAAKTRLGWMVYGPVEGKNEYTTRHVLHFRETHQNPMSELCVMMKGYFDVETFGIKAETKAVISKADERAINILKSTTKRIGNRFESGLLWKETLLPFPDSYEMALNRLKIVEKKMDRNKEYAQEYAAKINDYLNKGYARKLDPAEAERHTNTTFYLPHFGVRNPNKKGLRLVFDAAAEVKGISLNKTLLPGPDINQPLIAILFKFRQAPIAVCGDISEMFHQILIAKDDQDSQRFLWRGGDASKPVETYVMQRLIFGATCSPTIAQYVKNTNALDFQNECPRAVKGIIEKHYVDDYVDCFRTVEEATIVVKDVIRIHEAGGFQMRNIISNSDQLKRSVGSAASDSGDIPMNVDGKVERVLGMHWMSKTDVFVYVFKFNKVPSEILKCERKPTKREMLSLNMSVFDPFGFLANFMVTAKVLMQATWKASIIWDEPIPDGIYLRWKNWMQELPKVEELRIPRCYFSTFEEAEVALHIFVDASEEALAAVGYWRSVSHKNVMVNFIAAKSSCAPTRFHTIPKLELQAAVMGVRLMENIKKCHTIKIKNLYFWSDSQTVIRWIRSDHRVYKQFVANRVSEILEYSKLEEWRWCPGELNPADEATRAKFPVNYNIDDRWIKGPEFLSKPENEWPNENAMRYVADESSSELRTKNYLLLARQVVLVAPMFNRFSNYSRLKRAAGWLLRYCRNLKKKMLGDELSTGELSSEEESAAENYLCRLVQGQAYAKEYFALKAGEAVSEDSEIRTLNPFIGDNELIRVNGRIENATCLSLEGRRPVILPKQHQFTRLLVQHYHAKMCHINVSTVISEIRLRFWIPSLRRLVNSVQSHCLFCRIRKAKPRQPQMGILPVDRVTPYVRPFSYTGLDFFGPVSVTVRRQREKRWVALFTCLTIRAVHLEIAADLSSDACLTCIRNFVNRRGVPLQIRSDNGTNFVGIAKELRGVHDFIDHDAMTLGLSPLGIKWIFNTPCNPSAGGAWERLVQSVKKALYIMLKEHSPRIETLQSFLIEAENLVNSRPLTHLAVTPDDPAPLTPNHFLLGCPNSTQTPAPYEPKLMCLRKQWRIVQNLKNGMWRQWLREYLPELTRRTKWCLPSKPLSIGSLVFICDVDVPRSQWKRGRVLKLYYAKDGIARSAEVNTNTGVFKRPVSKLAVLDVVVSTEDGESSPSGSVHGGGDVEQSPMVPV